ncbi:GGDEF domain-containing protein [Terriglobus tenax]|uniref:GGDEF domain-containing protein n=1 Tax=Terriglobus tenax TaxID=1111115 RepID=UPI0021DFF604|nr:GGDEF domain-containing protein [Terriglobus tenax]
MQFPAELEKQFEADVSPARSKRLSQAMLLMAVLNAMFIFSDYHSIHNRFMASLVLRIVIFPVLAFFTARIVRANPPRIVRGATIIMLAGAAAGTMFYLYRDADDVVTANLQVGLLLILLGTNVVMRLRWLYSLFCTLACIATSVAFLRFNASLDLVDKIHLGTVTACSAALVLVATYSLEREERLAYLLQQSNELKTTELAEANRELEMLSHQDGLTRLANRAAFDRHFEELWRQSTAEGTPLSVVMIDIDHFKIVNDTQGHLYGDEVIKRVATLVQQSLRGRDDFAARYGGEEFVLLLPATNLDTAIKVAERVRLLIKMAGSPAPNQPVPQPEVGLWTTVSCGVATATGIESMDRSKLLAAADMALYAAKAEGRNRVCAAPLLGVTEKQPQA